MSSSTHSQSSKTSAEDLHQQFKKMTIEYGFMMTGVSPEMVGRNQADRMDMDTVDFSELSKLPESELELVIQKLIYANKDAMTKPPNSCGDQSNQVCELFLGMKGAEDFFQARYEICVKPTDVFQDLQTAIVSSYNENRLIRFEIDIGEDLYLFVQKKIKTPAELASNLLSDSPSIKLTSAFVLLEESLCFVYNNKMTVLPVSLEEKKHLSLLFSALQEKMEFDIYFSWLNPDNEYGIAFLLEDINFVGLHKESFSELNKAISRQADAAVNMWTGSHSYTLFISGNSKSDQQITTSSALTFPIARPISLYQYQAYAGAHTLQEWIGGKKESDKLKFNMIAQYSVQEYMQILSGVVSEDGKARAKAYSHLFKQFGDEEERFKASALSGASAKERIPLRLKYKMVSVNPYLAKTNLDKLLNSFKEFGNDPKTQVATYEKRTIEAFSQRLRTYVKEASLGLSTTSSLSR
jgi:hypothetical protein